MNRSPFTTRTLVVLTLTLVCLSGLLIAFHFRQARLSTSALPGLQGAAAVEHLKQQGLYSSLSDAMTATRYRIKASPDGEYVADNPANQLRADFAADSLELRATAQAWRLGIKLRSAGYGERQLQAGSGVIAADGNRIEYARPLGAEESAIREWYVNQPSGLEQGFTLAEPPGERQADEPLRLALALESALLARAEADGQAVEFLDLAGNRILRYDKLAVWDARGQALNARMSVNGEELRLEVEDAAAVYPVTIDPNFTQQAYLKASNTGANDFFGISVAISGDTVVVGATQEDSSTTGVNSTPNESASNSGGAYVFVRSGGVWTQQAYLKASNTEAGDEFGWAVAVSGDTVVVGATQEDSGTTGVNSTPDESASNSGAAYVFVRNAGVWTQQAYLKASNTGAGDYFGHSVAVSGDTVAVGARFEDSSTTGVNSTPNEGATDAGAAYVFVRSGGVWTQQVYLKASNTGGEDHFGASVAVSGDTVAVGAWLEDSSTTGVNSTPNESAPNSGAAYVFVRNAGVW
ncbi:MAG TPA: FG-GAP repeat protein, partial [Blastocatellia bacterium]